MKIGIIANTGRDKNLETTRAVIAKLSDTEMVTVASKHKDELSGMRHADGEQLYKEQDILLVLGGDGTLLKAARHAAPYGTPVLGINLGHLGFLSGAEKDEFLKGNTAEIFRDIRIENRMMLEAVVYRSGEQLASFCGLNDAVVRGVATDSLLRMTVTADEALLESYIADGIIFATPTGSTAYSFAAGSALVHPGMEALLVTPVCPHMLHARPVVLPGESVLEATFLPDSASAYLNVDGEDRLALEKDDRIEIRRAPYAAKIATLRHPTFLQILKEKLKG